MLALSAQRFDGKNRSARAVDAAQYSPAMIHFPIAGAQP